MPNFRGLDTDVGWQKREFAKVWRALRELSAAKRLQAATIGEGGITLKDGGSLRAPYPEAFGTGDAIFIGPVDEGGIVYYLIQLTDGTPDSDPLMLVRAIPDQPDFPGGLTQVSFSADIASLEAATSVTARLPATDEGLSVANAETFLKSTGAVKLVGGTDGVQITHSTTGSAANCFIGSSDNRIWRSTSSRRYKQDIEDAEVDPAVVLQMLGRTWRDKAEVEANPDTETRYIGFIAEELHDLGLGQFVVYDEAGDPEAIAYDRLCVALLAVLKDQQQRIEALEAKAAQ